MSRAGQSESSILYIICIKVLLGPPHKKSTYDTKKAKQITHNTLYMMPKSAKCPNPLQSAYITESCDYEKSIGSVVIWRFESAGYDYLLFIWLYWKFI